MAASKSTFRNQEKDKRKMKKSKKRVWQQQNNEKLIFQIDHKLYTQIFWMLDNIQDQLSKKFRKKFYRNFISIEDQIEHIENGIYDSLYIYRKFNQK